MGLAWVQEGSGVKSKSDSVCCEFHKRLYIQVRIPKVVAQRCRICDLCFWGYLELFKTTYIFGRLVLESAGK